LSDEDEDETSIFSQKNAVSLTLAQQLLKQTFFLGGNHAGVMPILAKSTIA